MFEPTTCITFMAPDSLLKKIEKIRALRMKKTGHISRSSLMRELLFEQAAWILDEEKGLRQRLPESSIEN